MAVWFTSDTHFGHAAIIELSDRPFASAEEMDAAMTANWNAVIAPADEVYHLGDFCYRNSRAAPEYLSALNGKVHLIAGNHDGLTLKHHRDAFASVHEMKEVKLDGHHIVLCHYPMREWHGVWRGAWHLFGHVHGRLNHEPLGLSLDVGVDSNRFRPWALTEIEALFAKSDNPFAQGRRPEPVRKTIREP
jgi:calcineurin-like phosphoesterase family protein